MNDIRCLAHEQGGQPMLYQCSNQSCCIDFPIVIDLQPFNIVEDKGFRALINYLDPRYNIPSVNTLKTLVINAYKGKKRNVQAELDEVSDICDTWTSINTDHFLIVTCHFINNNFEMEIYTPQSFLEAIGISVAATECLINVFSNWNIQEKVGAVVTDNAANML